MVAVVGGDGRMPTVTRSLAWMGWSAVATGSVRLRIAHEVMLVNVCPKSRCGLIRAREI